MFPWEPAPRQGVSYLARGVWCSPRQIVSTTRTSAFVRLTRPWSPSKKAFLLQMAQNWRKLAEQAARTQTLVDPFKEPSLR